MSEWYRFSPEDFGELVEKARAVFYEGRRNRFIAHGKGKTEVVQDFTLAMTEDGEDACAMYQPASGIVGVEPETVATVLIMNAAAIDPTTAGLLADCLKEDE